MLTNGRTTCQDPNLTMAETCLTLLLEVKNRDIALYPPNREPLIVVAAPKLLKRVQCNARQLFKTFS